MKQRRLSEPGAIQERKGHPHSTRVPTDSGGGRAISSSIARRHLPSALFLSFGFGGRRDVVIPCRLHATGGTAVMAVERQRLGGISTPRAPERPHRHQKSPNSSATTGAVLDGAGTVLALSLRSLRVMTTVA